MEDIAKTPSINEMESWLSKKFFKKERSEIILCLSILIYTIVFSSLTILRHYAFQTRAWDLGIFTQSLWTTLNANSFFYHTCEIFLNPTGSFFGVHFSPILFLILPLYWVFQAPETLLVFQSFILALATFPLYKLTKEDAGGRIVGIVFVFAYLLYPATHTVNWYDFHVQAFLPLFFFCAIYYIAKENWPRYFLFAFLLLMCEEHVAITMFFMGVYISWMHRKTIVSAIKRKELTEKKLVVPAVTMIMSIVWYGFTTWQRNTFFPIAPECMSEFLGAPNFTILGAKDPLEIPLLIILRPWNFVQALAYDGHVKLLYIALIFGPLAFLSFKNPVTLIPTISWFAFSFISQTTCHHMIGHQYEAYTVAFIFSAAVFALKKNFWKTSSLKSVGGSLKRIMLFTFVFFIMASPLCPVVNFLFPEYALIHVGEHEMMISEVLSMIPQNASILTQDNIFPQVSHRVDAYVVPNRFLNSSIRNLVIDFLNQTLDNVEYVLLDNKTDPIATEFILSLLVTKPQFTLRTSRDDGTILLYKRQP